MDGTAVDDAEPHDPLTQRQLLIWLGAQRDLRFPEANMVMRYEIDGPIDSARFVQAFTSVVRECDALRTVFEEHLGEPRQRILPPADAAIEVHDLSAEPDPEAVCERLCAARAAQNFDLDRRCYDALLIQLSDARYVWLLVQHHLITDGVSCGLLYRHVAERYAGNPPRPIPSFRSYAGRERAYRSSRRADRDAAFWAPRLRRTIEPVPFYGKAQPNGTQHVRVVHALSLERSDRVRALAMHPSLRTLSEAVTHSVIFETVLFAYLSRIRGTTSVAVGAPLHNRQGRAAREIVGCLIEVAPIQADVAPDDTYETLFRKLLDDTYQVLRHAQHATPNAANHRVFDVMYNFHTASFEPFADFPTRTAFTTGLNALPAMADDVLRGESLIVQVHDFDRTGRFHLLFDFHATQFDEDARVQAVAHFLRLLDGMLDDLSTRVSDAPLLSSDERSVLVTEFNDNAAPVATDLVTAFETWATNAPSRLAVRCGTEQRTFGALDRRANQLAHALVDQGVGRDDLVAVMLDRSVDLVVALLATLKAGAAYVPLDPTHPAARNAMALEDAKPRVVLTERAFRDRVRAPASTFVLCLDEPWHSDYEARDDAPARTIDPAQLAYVIFTSGSTGRPKGVQVPRGALANFLASMQKAPGFTVDDGILSVTTVSFDIAALELFLPLVSGAFVEIADRTTVLDPDAIMAHLASGRISVLQATPATWRMLLEAGWTGTRGLVALCGGEAMPRSLANALCERADAVWNMYGPTETTIWSTIHPVTTSEGPVPIGRPVANTEVYVLDPRGRLLPRGCIGELYIGGAGVALGYLGRPELTEERFVPNPFASGRLYRTGDLARWRSDGTLECFGRVDFQVKVRGYRIELGEIEAAILRYGVFQEVIVVAQDLGPRADAADVGADKRLVAYGTVARGQELDVMALKAFLRERLPSYMVPAVFVPLDAFPLTPNGKVDRKALPEPAADTETTAQHPPETDLELRIAALWRQVLQVEVIDRHDDFFEIGGNSLLAVRLVAELSLLAKEGITLGTFLRHATVAGLAEVLSGGAISDEPIVIPLNGAGGPRPLFCICGIHLYQTLAAELDGYPVCGVYLPAEHQLLKAAEADGAKVALPTVEELAAEYVAAIRSRQAAGPYLLAGVSFGGVLAFEMARHLRARGETVALLALFDAMLPQALKARPSKWLFEHLTRARREGAGYLLERPKIRKALRRVPKVGGWILDRADARPSSGRMTQQDLEAFQQMRARTYIDVMRRYQKAVAPYAGDALLFRASENQPFPGYEIDAEAGWGELVTGHLEVVSVPGDHIGILSGEGVACLGERLREALGALRLLEARGEEEHRGS